MVDIPMVAAQADLRPPAYARHGDAGADLCAAVDAVVPAGGGRVLVPTGLRVAIPEGCAGFVLPRSGLALHHGITLANSPGLIDCGYRDEVKVVLLNTDPCTDYQVSRGDRIAQLVVLAVEHAVFLPAEDLPPTSRGGGGFGHTGR